MTFRRFFLSVLFFLTLSSSSFAQSANTTQTLRGQVVDRISQAPLVGAHIIVRGTDPLLGTTSDAEGQFVLHGVPLGRRDIEVRYLGYETVIRPGILFASGKEVVLNVALEEQPNLGEEVVVTPKTQRGQPLNDLAMVSARSFTVEETRRYAGGLDDPARMVSAFAGVTTSDIGTNAISIRGNAPKSVQWRLEGIEIPNPNHFAGANVAGGGAVTLFSNHLLTDSDFFTGAFPAAYGNALSGVFDMRLRSGNAATHEHAVQVGLLGIDIGSEGPLAIGRQASYLFNYRYSTLALLTPLLPEESVIKYQDLSFKVNVPTRNLGRFAVWGIGGLDVNRESEERDSTLWSYEWDRVNHDLSMDVGALGVRHDLVVGSRGYLQTTATLTGSRSEWNLRRLDDRLALQNDVFVKTTDARLILGSNLNLRLGQRHTNQTGFFLHRLLYDSDFQVAPAPGLALQPVSGGNGASTLTQFFTQSKLDLTRRLRADVGLHVQHLALTGRTAVEPRTGLRWEIRDGQTLSLGYGLHSQIEELRIYLARGAPGNNSGTPNRNLDFTRAHHLVLGYDRALGSVARMKLETYVQSLFDVPVIADSSYSMLNFAQDWEFGQALVNTGAGRNYGVELTLERFLRNGFYGLMTGSLFKSRYRGGDNVWRNTRWDRGYTLTALAGKEFTVGGDDQLGLNARFELTGGMRHSPYDVSASHAVRELIFDHNRAFTVRDPDVYVFDFTITYRRNHRRYSGIWALQVKNALTSGTVYADYNYDLNAIEEVKERIILPILSYKIEF